MVPVLNPVVGLSQGHADLQLRNQDFVGGRCATISLSEPRPNSTRRVNAAIKTGTNYCMSISRVFWQRLFADGSISFDAPPQGNLLTEKETVSLLAPFFQVHSLEVGGPPLCFVESVAAKAARVVELAAWYFVSQAGTAEDLERDLATIWGEAELRTRPQEPAEHLSADLALQYLPTIYHRARALFPADRLPALLGDILRRWPLSGVLADLPDAPLGDLDFGGHPGLLLLYAERLAENFKPAWIPRGLGAPHMELVWAELGKDPALLVPARSASEETSCEELNG